MLDPEPQTYSWILKDNCHILSFPLPTFSPQIHRFVSSCWQKRWDKEGANESINKAENKLHSIMPIISEDLLGCKKRRDDVIISRLRLGHTKLTHSYLMENRPPPICNMCSSNSQLSIKHILLECSFLNNIRQRHYQVNDMNQLFKKVSP